MGWGSWSSHLTVFQSSACQSIPSKRYNKILAARISLCFTATASAETRHSYTWRGDIDTEYCLCYSHQPFNRKKWGGADDDGWWGWGAAGDMQHEGQEIGFADAWGKFWVCSYESSCNVFLSLIAFVITMYLLLFTNCCCICLLAVQYYTYLIAFLISTDILKKWYVVHTVNTWYRLIPCVPTVCLLIKGLWSLH